MAREYLKSSRHRTVFYFRRRVPDDLLPCIGKRYLVKSLDTSKRREAIIRARILAAQTDHLFFYLRNMPPNEHDADGLKINFTLFCDFDELGRKRAKASDVMPGEEVAAAEGVARLQSLFDGAPMPALFQASGAAHSAPPGKTISQAWEAYKAEKITTNTWKDGEGTAKYDHWPHIRDLIKIVGDKPLNYVTAEDVERFQNYILSDKPDESARNKDKRLSRAGALFRWAKKKRTYGVTDDLSDLFSYPGDIPKNTYMKFDLADLAALFESEEYREHRFKTPSEYWIPLLALFTGARLNELCQLTINDVGAHDGVKTISILDDEYKRLKNGASRRIVPIHSKLVELGFLDYVATVKKGRVFPELPQKAHKQNDFSKEPSRKFTDYRRRMGVGGDRLNPETGKWEGNNRKAFHSFRSTLISALRKAEVPKDRRTRLAGHEFGDTQDREYDGGDALTMFDFRTLKSDIEKAVYEVAFTPYRFIPESAT